MKACYDHLPNSAGFYEREEVWLYHPTRTRGKLLKLQPTWEGPYKVVTQINDAMYRIQHIIPE
jgi:hypothetical protein